tara:strand:+ start:163 stop:1020 length:858 start_codon:yes stop_codon:yes gene_type:complete
MSNNSTLPIIAVGALGLLSVSCVVSSLTGFLVSGDSNVESNASTSNTSTDTSNTNTDTSNTSTDTSNTSTDTSNTSTETDYAIPYQIRLGADGWCNETDAVHQDVPGCGRICSTAINVGSKRDSTWGPWADNSDVASTCVGAKLDEIWELQDDGIRKLADGYIVSSSPTEEEAAEAAAAEAAAAEAAAALYTIKAKTRFKPSKMTYGYVNISDGSKSKYSTNSLMSDTTVNACISKCNELEKCTSFQWVPGDKYCNMVSDKPFSQGSLLRTMIESNDRYEIYIKP